MTDFDLETTYLFLDGTGGLVAQHAGPDFWADIAGNPNARNTLVSTFGGDGDWDSWEMHPAGAEVLVVLDGAPVVWLEHPDGALQRIAARPGATVIAPKGAWHRCECDHAYKMLFITYGAGTRHRPVTADDLERAAALA
jgi:quercetin dioxygenase-like cupin family protein